jgi:transcriptional regulator with XRE-family HTH domain
MAKRATITDQYVGSRVKMRRMMLKMSQDKLSQKLGLTFQQIQKYEKGINRIGASRLQELALILRVPVGFFFEGAPAVSATGASSAVNPDFVSEFLLSADGLRIAKAFTEIASPKVRRSIVRLVMQFVGEEDG